MSFVHGAADLVLHLDRHLSALLGVYGLWLYPIVFAVIFAETGLVVAAFLPGDSLLFALGALTAIDRSGTLRIGSVLILLFIPIIRTFSPFVAGIGRMPIARFQLVNIVGASAWVLLFVLGGFA